MVSPGTLMNPNATRPSREQLRNVLAVALDACQSPEPRPLSTYEPLAWLLRDDIGYREVRRARRSLYLKLVRDLAREFDRLYRERLVALNGPWDFADVYIAADKARTFIRRMRWCAFLHLCRLPGAGVGSVQSYDAMMKLLNRGADPYTA